MFHFESKTAFLFLQNVLIYQIEMQVNVKQGKNITRQPFFKTSLNP